jgi:Tripartite tricarboxylate transporter TctB family
LLSDQGPPPPEAQPDAHAEGAWARPVPARLGEAGVALALLATGLFFMWHAALLPFGRVGLPGPGFFPFALGSGLVLLALAILYVVWRSPGEATSVFLGHRDVLIALAALAGVAFTFERADAYLVLGTFAAALLLLVARSTLWRVVLGAIIGMIVVWLFFVLALGVRLPTGEFWQQLMDLIPRLSSSDQQ